jgi:hypothetical protein
MLTISGRTVRKWTGGEQKMPCSGWRLLLVYIGEVDPEEMIPPLGAVAYAPGQY